MRLVALLTGCLLAVSSVAVAATPTIAPITGSTKCPSGQTLQQKVTGSTLKLVCTPNKAPLTTSAIVTPTLPPKVFKTPKPRASPCKHGGSVYRNLFSVSC